MENFQTIIKVGNRSYKGEISLESYKDLNTKSIGLKTFHKVVIALEGNTNFEVVLNPEKFETFKAGINGSKTEKEFTRDQLSLFSETYGEILIIVDGLYYEDKEKHEKLSEILGGRFGVYKFCRELALELEVDRNWSTQDWNPPFVEYCEQVARRNIEEIIALHS